MSVSGEYACMLEEEQKSNECKRPAIPPVLVFALVLWAACAVSIAFGENLDAGFCRVLAGACIALCALACAIALKRHAARALPLICIGLLAGASLGLGHSAHLHAQMDALGDGVSGRFDFMIVEDPRMGDYGSYATARTHIDGIGEVKVRVSFGKGDALSCWERFSATCMVRSAASQGSSSAWMHGCAGKARIRSLETYAGSAALGMLSAVRANALELFCAHECEGAVLVESIALGARQRLFESSLYGDVKAVGLAHIVAVSGAHLAIVSSFILLLTRTLRLPRRPAALLQLALLAAFLVLTGAPHSALRAALMVACATGALFAKRRGWALNALGACIVVLLVPRPELALSLSFALSASATLSILVFSSYFAWWLTCLTHGRAAWLCELMGMSCAAILGTAPIAWGMFGQLPLLGPITSVVAMPVCALLCIGGLITVLLDVCAPGLALLAVELMVEAGEGCCKLVHAAASVPYACIGVPFSLDALSAVFIVGLACLYVAWPPPTVVRSLGVVVATVCALVCCVVVAPRLHGDEIVMLDVGQGDAIVLRSGAQTVLVDTGNQDALVVKALARHDVREVDLLIVTHADDDHCGSLEAIRNAVVVHSVGVAGDLLECSCENCSSLRASLYGVHVVALEKGDVVSWGSFTAEVLWPERFSEEGGNQDSLVLDVSLDCDHDSTFDWTMLCTGDAEAPTINKLARQGALHAFDILKVGHHGSRASLDPKTAELLDPRIALISCGANNRYGHPAPDTLHVLEKSGAQVLRTDTQGDVSCYLTSQAIEVRTLR